MLKKPYLISEVKREDGKNVKSYSPEDYKRLMTAEQAGILTEMMEEVVKTGTASKLKGLSYTAAGKTGSAEFTDSTSDSHAWFTGFAPAEDPEICVTIIVENAGSGGSFAVPIAKRIFDSYFGVE
jgi:peptidoglycan glycosyltransferase